MWSKWNGAASVRCHPAMNWPIPVASTELWASCEPLRHHVLKIARPYIFWDVYRFEIPPNRNIVLALETPIPRGFVLPFFVLHTKNHTTYFTQPKITFRNINFCLKKILYFFRSYLVAAWFSHTLLTTVLCSLSKQNLCIDLRHPFIDLRHPFRMLGYLTPLKQWNLHRQFKRRWYYSSGLNVCEPENKWNKLNSDYFINYVVIFFKKN